ncbi:GGDEF domain-containing protein [Pseudobutyrivibrio sp. YE44]|uniref:GGDEF domain-containing protein n=1 Tax=Pseudobutyrivibrio sp. YE44 TaxID=1520802 RepID=UPI0015A07B31|nr:GGDEF domain-containing protein [Pseudobutyrivibrio sp. YE44]
MEKLRKVENEKYLDMACDLFDMAQESGNEDLRDYSSCSLGDALWQNNRFSEAVYYLTAGLQGLQKTDEYKLICRCYNEMGIIMRNEGHFITSEENFLNSIDVARINQMYLQEAIACGNFAALCEEMGAMQECLEYHYRSLECSQFIEEASIRTPFLVGEYSQLAIAYIVLGGLEDAKKHLDEMNRLNEEVPDPDNDFDVAIANWLYYSRSGDIEAVEKYKADSINAFKQCYDVMVYFDEIEILLQLLLERKDYSIMEEVFKDIDEKLGDYELFNLRLHLERWKIRMYECTGEEAKRDLCSYRYYQYHEKRSLDSKKSFTTTLRLKNELIQQRTKNLFLSAAAETDTLTGLANRAKLNNVIDELFLEALNNGKNLGVEMMDLDFFKQVNDNLGHAKGDSLLAAIGRRLREMVSDKIFIARYGGDEFILYYFDMTDEEIIEIVKRIRDIVEEVRVELNIDKLSVSQGIVNHVPQSANRAWDFLNSADYALYFVKEHGKANARLINGRNDLETKEWRKIF